MDHVQEEVWATVVALTRLWTVDGQPERLADYFAPEMVAITPTDRFRREGRNACVAAWTAFVRATRIHRWEEKNPLVLVLADGRSAVVAYDFDIDYEMGWPAHAHDRPRSDDVRQTRWPLVDGRRHVFGHAGVAEFPGWEYSRCQRSS